MDGKYLLSAVLVTALGESPALADPARAEVEADDGEPSPPRGGTFTVGAGFSTDDGFIASAAVSQDNLFGRGQKLALTARISERRQLFLLHFAEPHLADSDVGLSIDLYDQQLDWPGFTRSAAGGAITLSRPFGEHAVGFVSYRLEDVSVAPQLGGATTRLIEPGMWDPQLMMRGGLISSVRTGVLYNRLDRPLFPRKGTSAGAWIERADRILGSEIDLTRGRAFAGHHIPLGPLTFHVSGAVDAVTSSDPRGVPLSERLQLDGSSEVRGFAPGSLGPSLSGIALGGNLKASGRGELEFPLLSRLGLSGSIFYDAGGVIDLEGRSGSQVGHSVGVGLLWRSPLGPVRIDVAYPLDGEGGPSILFGIGATF